MLQLLLPLAWDALMLRTFAPEVWAALAAARMGKRVDAAGQVVAQEEYQEDEEVEDGHDGQHQKHGLAVDQGVFMGNLAKAMGAWALMYLDVVPWDTFVSMMAVDPAELAMQALEGGMSGADGTGRHEGGLGARVDIGEVESGDIRVEGVVPPQGSTV